MPLIEFKCMGRPCPETVYVFDTDLYTNPNTGERYPGFACACGCEYWEAIPPQVTVVHRTEIFMLTQLDSVHTIHDLDSMLQTEAADEREVREQNKARKEL